MGNQCFRIAMVAACPFPARRGTPLRVERLAEALVQRGHEVELATYDVAEAIYSHSHPVHRPSGRARLGTLPPGPTLAKLVRYDPALAKLLRKLLRKGSFDVIHAHHVEGVLAAAWVRHAARIPLVYDAHTMLSSELPSYGPGFPRAVKRRFGAWMDRWVPGLADHIVTVTPDIRERLIHEFGQHPDRITVAMNGVETERFAEVDADSAVPDRVIYCGTLAPYQGIELLLRAFASARLRRPSLQLEFVASASFAPYEEIARRLGIRLAITLTSDSLDLLPQRLAGAALAVLPRPVCDGIPQKLLNYMAAAKPVVAFKGSAKGLVHEKTGLVVESGNVEEFARGIVRLAEDTPFARRLGREARRYVVSHCSWDSAATRCELVYDGLLEQPAAGLGALRWERPALGRNAGSRRVEP